MFGKGDYERAMLGNFFSALFLFTHVIPPPVACLLANCERFFARCEITSAGLARCVCPVVERCPVISDVVCANDSRTYTTECHMRVEACQRRTSLTVVKKGTCSKCGILYIF